MDASFPAATQVTDGAGVTGVVTCFLELPDGKVLVGGAFVIAGVSVVDPAAAGRGAPWSFRLMILPGAAVLWPIVLVKWVRAARPHRQEHP